ncbi:transglycosylase SLT domain-containing protein [Nocardioides sp.]|uniref:transglycosylase SLT domain-containing protein n=1 Tax=Nocardioides sp. TaxID=35761 RepID=UPI00351463BF
MSINDVTARISQIQNQLAQLAPAGVASADGAAVADTLAASGVDGASGVAATGMGAVAGGSGVTGADVVAQAKKMLGLPYIWGGNDPTKGVDCSGLVQQAYKALGIDLPRVSNQQAREGTPVASLAQAQPGDLIAWDNSSRNNGVDHIAIYIGGGKMIEAPRTGLNIRIVDVPSEPDVIRRIIGSPDGVSARVAAGSGAGGSASSVSVPGGIADRVGSGVPFSGLINAAAARTGVPGELLAAVAKQESGFNPTAVSPAGARGLMQLMPGTARGLGVTDPMDPAQAIDGGARLLRSLLDKFGTVEKALAAYNAGAGAVARYDGIPPYRETQNYVRNIMAMVRS